MRVSLLLIGLPLLAVTAAAQAPPCTAGQAARMPALTALEGTMMLGADSSDAPVRLWASGDNVRTVTVSPQGTIVMIQRRDTVYVYQQGTVVGQAQRLGGFDGLSLIRQIAEIRAHGRLEGATVMAGVCTLRYAYDVAGPAPDAPRVLVQVGLAQATGLPVFWSTVTRYPDGESSTARIAYRDMRTDLPEDTLFRLPPTVRFRAGN